MSRSIKDILINTTDPVESERKAMFDSLMNAVSDAGGNRQMIFDAVVYGQMTVLELIDKLGQNKVRFRYVKED